MYLSYYQHQELTMLDERECKQFGGKYCKDFIKVVRTAGMNYYVNGEVPEYHDGDDEDKYRLLRFTFNIMDEVRNGFYANPLESVYFISKKFREAYNKSLRKMLPLVQTAGTLRQIHEDCCIINNKETYILKTLPDGYIRFMSIKTGYLSDVHEYRLTDEGISDLHTAGVTSYQHTDDSCNDTVSEMKRLAGIKHNDTLEIVLLYGILLFKKYGQVEIETVSANKTLRKSQILGEKVNNFMGIDVQVLDSRWFTTICRDEGFLVSGHFRLQPCKDEQGEWTRKLIYINPYAKHGYHRLAPIVNINNE